LPLLVFTHNLGQKTNFEIQLEMQGIKSKRILSSNYLLLLLELCRSGKGIGIFGDNELINHSGLKALKVPFNQDKVEDKLFLLWSKTSENTQSVKTVIKILDQLD
jgi:DNA-binding transcriptional LysR family regulator